MIPLRIGVAEPITKLLLVWDGITLEPILDSVSYDRNYRLCRTIQEYESMLSMVRPALIVADKIIEEPHRFLSLNRIMETAHKLGTGFRIALVVHSKSTISLCSCDHTHRLSANFLTVSMPILA